MESEEESLSLSPTSRVPRALTTGGWPAVTGAPISTGEFFVAAHPTQGAGVMTTVIGIPPAIDRPVGCSSCCLRSRHRRSSGPATYAKRTRLRLRLMT